MTTADFLISQLKRAGMRITPQRVAICTLLTSKDAHPTAAIIYEEIKKVYPSLSLMTVYNTLNKLVELGIINTLGHIGDDNVHYDAHNEPHINLACISCHKIIDIPSEHVNHLEMEISASRGYKILGSRILYYGLCPDCQNQISS
ncbi:MAG: transcriptional repressor [Anaerolineae bacterium]|nr:transcriptional repressor [Anaerolineae bacterium]